MANSRANDVSLIGGRYAVEREIGRGGMAVVMLAIDVRSNRRVAVKLLRPEIANAVSTDRFLREIEITRKFQHPSILPVDDFGVEDGIPFYVMPFVEGESLRQRLKREKQLPIADALAIVRQMLDALVCAHAHGVIHRDITPANILLASGAEQPKAYVADFGIALAMSQAETERLTSTGLVLGTPEYMSPEQAAGERELDARSDIYAVGAVLYEMIAGEPPFTGPTVQALLGRKAVSRAPSVRALRPAVSARLERIVARTLEPAPADRFRTAAELIAALDAIHSADKQPFAGFGRRRELAIAVVLVVAGLVVATASIRKLGEPERQFRTATASLDAGRFADAANDFRSLASNVGRLQTAARVKLAYATFLSDSDASASWRGLLAAARRDTAGLDEKTHEYLRALTALAQGDFPVASNGFRSLARDDPTATIALMECIKRDSIIVDDLNSPSKMRFRSDFNEAIRDGQQLLIDVPRLAPIRSVVYARTIEFLYPMRGPVRTGHRFGTPQEPWIAFPTFRPDTLGGRVEFIPYPASVILSGTTPLEEASNESAINRDRGLLRDLALNWVHEFPQSASAHLTLGFALELTGELTSMRAGAPSAIDEIKLARRLGTDRRRDLALSVDETRLLLKQGLFDQASRLADSVLEKTPESGPGENRDLSLLAALTGRTDRSAHLLGSTGDEMSVLLPDGRRYKPPPEVGSASLALLAYAAAGAPADSIRVFQRRTEELIERYVPSSNVAGVRSAVLERALSLSVPTLGPSVVAGLEGRTIGLIPMQHALARGDRAEVRRQLDSLAGLRNVRTAATTTLDETYQEAWLRLAIGDTVLAVRSLDLTLEALPALPPSAFDDVPAAAAFVRAMRLRAELAAAVHDEGTAARWTSALRALSHASSAAPEHPSEAQKRR